nr:hypothetical protein [Prevotella jejuni]
MKHKHADGNSTEWQRDRLGRVTRYAAPGQSVMRISYDAYDLPSKLPVAMKCGLWSTLLWVTCAVRHDGRAVCAWSVR